MILSSDISNHFEQISKKNLNVSDSLFSDF